MLVESTHPRDTKQQYHWLGKTVQSKLYDGQQALNIHDAFAFSIGLRPILEFPS